MFTKHFYRKIRNFSQSKYLQIILRKYSIHIIYTYILHSTFIRTFLIIFKKENNVKLFKGSRKTFERAKPLSPYSDFRIYTRFALKYIYSYLYIFNRANNSSIDKRNRKGTYSIIQVDIILILWLYWYMYTLLLFITTYLYLTRWCRKSGMFRILSWNCTT